ncbi:hypothetical protein BO70DRAFT_414337, partial [Aspergillus heteromorphus CBS 117.55]
SHHHNHHNHRHQHPSITPQSPQYPPSNPTGRISPSTAFRESLFDALGDDEGASYWESVYGQPIHTYAVPTTPNPATGELEMMDEEEYVAYVRSKMWERTREGMLAEQERVRGERMRKKRREERREAERMRFQVEVEGSLRRGGRGGGEGLGEAWVEYARAWAWLDARREGGKEEGDGFRELVFWPVESGKRRDVCREKVEEFLRRCPGARGADGDGDGEGSLLATLKTERVRWHPDKIQHRYGGLGKGIDEAVMRSVTEVFQIVDHMWNEERKKQTPS